MGIRPQMLLSNLMNRFAYRRAADRFPISTWALHAVSPSGDRAIVLRREPAANDDQGRPRVIEMTGVAFQTSGAVPVVTREWRHFQAAGQLGGLAEDGAFVFQADQSHGTLETGERSMAWRVRIEDIEPPLVSSDSASRLLGAGPLEVLRPKVRLTGRVRVNGDEWSLTGWQGALAFGARSRSPRAMVRCAQWSSNADVTMVVWASSVGPLGADRLVVQAAVRERGIRHDLTGVMARVRGHARVTERRFRFALSSAAVKLEGEAWAPTERFAGLHRTGRLGSDSHSLLAGLADMRVDMYLEGGECLRLTSHSAHLDIESHDAHHGVVMCV